MREKSTVIVVQLPPTEEKYGGKKYTYRVKQTTNRTEPKIGAVISESEVKNLQSPYCKVTIIGQ